MKSVIERKEFLESQLRLLEELNQMKSKVSQLPNGSLKSSLNSDLQTMINPDITFDTIEQSLNANARKISSLETEIVILRNKLDNANRSLESVSVDANPRDQSSVFPKLLVFLAGNMTGGIAMWSSGMMPG